MGVNVPVKPCNRIDKTRHIGGFVSPSGRDIFCLKNFDTVTRTPVRVSKMNADARAQLTFQMLTLLKNYLYRQSQC